LGVKKLQKNVNTEDKKSRCRDCNGTFSEHGKLKVIVKYVEVQDYVNTIKLKVSVNPVEVHCFDSRPRKISVFRM
jgi:uncharacterized protein with PIN domain